MLELSNISTDKIKDKVYLNYDLRIDNIKIINKGSANIFKLYSDNGKKYILKEFQAKYKEDDVLEEIKAIQYLKENTDIPVTNVLKCKNGNYYFKNKGRIINLQEYIEGYDIGKNEGNYKDIIESAHLLGKIIKGFENYKTNRIKKISEWCSSKELELAISKYNEIIKKANNTAIGERIKEDMFFKINLIKDLQQKINFTEINKITHKVSHGDYSCLQFIYDENNNIKAVLDFIKVKKLPIIWEIARSYSYIDIKAKNGEIDINNLIDYTMEVNKIVKLNEYDLKYLSFVYLIQLARSTFGYVEYFENTVNKDEMLNFAFYRTNLCRNLKGKAEEISNKLLKYKRSN